VGSLDEIHTNTAKDATYQENPEGILNKYVRYCIHLAGIEHVLGVLKWFEEIGHVQREHYHRSDTNRYHEEYHEQR
jgi:hypothetical protein